MALTGSQFKTFQNALLEAFDRASLQQMVRIGLDENLDAIAGGTNLREQTFNLIKWAEHTGSVDKLLAAAREANPRNPALSDFEAGYHPNVGAASQANVAPQQYNVGGDVYQIGHLTGTTIAIGRNAHVGGSADDKPDAASS